MRLRRACLSVLLVAACTNPGTQQDASATRAVTVAQGTILSVHAVPAAPQVTVWRLLSADATPAAALGASLAEFIVRQDDGTTISIVQDSGLGLHAGDRVDIVRGERAHLTRA